MIVLDTEQTGTKDNAICQLAFIDVGEELTGWNAFYSVKEMNDHAAEVNGFSVSKLDRLSGGRRFSEDAPMLCDRLSGQKIVGHSISSDLAVLKAEFGRCGIRMPSYSRHCTMIHFRPVLNIRRAGQRRAKDPSLAELCLYLGVLPASVQGLSVRLFGAHTAAHDARYDVCATYLCIQKATEKGMIRGLLPEGR